MWNMKYLYLSIFLLILISNTDDSHANIPGHNLDLDYKCPPGFQWSRKIVACGQAQCPAPNKRTYTLGCKCNSDQKGCYKDRLLVQCINKNLNCPATVTSTTTSVGANLGSWDEFFGYWPSWLITDIFTPYGDFRDGWNLASNRENSLVGRAAGGGLLIWGLIQLAGLGLIIKGGVKGAKAGFRTIGKLASQASTKSAGKKTSVGFLRTAADALSSAWDGVKSGIRSLSKSESSEKIAKEVGKKAGKETAEKASKEAAKDLTPQLVEDLNKGIDKILSRPGSSQASIARSKLKKLGQEILERDGKNLPIDKLTNKVIEAVGKTLDDAGKKTLEATLASELGSTVVETVVDGSKTIYRKLIK